MERIKIFIKIVNFMSVLRAHAFRASYTVTEWMEQWYKCLLFTYIRLLFLLLLCCSCRRFVCFLFLQFFFLLYLCRKIKGRHELDDDNKCFLNRIDACVSSYVQHPIPRHTWRWMYLLIFYYTVGKVHYKEWFFLKFQSKMRF